MLTFIFLPLKITLHVCFLLLFWLRIIQGHHFLLQSSNEHKFALELKWFSEGKTKQPKKSASHLIVQFLRIALHLNSTGKKFLCQNERTKQKGEKIKTVSHWTLSAKQLTKSTYCNLLIVKLINFVLCVLWRFLQGRKAELSSVDSLLMIERGLFSFRCGRLAT